MIRVTAGALRGRRIPVPPDEVRPTSEKARQAFFNIVNERIGGARVRDLFAVSGIFSFEAFSRGARECVAVDKSRRHTQTIERAARDLEAPIRTVTADAIAGIKRLGAEVFDVIYADPPYAYEQYGELLMNIDQHVTLAGGAIVAIEHRRRTEPFAVSLTNLHFSRRAEYGEVWISFFIA